MLKEIKNIISVASKQYGWVMEPDAKRILKLAGVEVPEYCWAKTPTEALNFAKEHGYPLAMKVVSPKIIHKSDAGGVITGIKNQEELFSSFEKMGKMEGFSGIHLEKMCSGIELIIGAKIDFQFGPVVMLGMGGISVEIYKDTVIHMAPLNKNDARSMANKLKAHELLEGFRGAKAINMDSLTNLLVTFSQLVTDLSGEIESIDLNPVFCNENSCVAADARIILPSEIK